MVSDLGSKKLDEMIFGCFEGSWQKEQHDEFRICFHYLYVIISNPVGVDFDRIVR